MKESKRPAACRRGACAGAAAAICLILALGLAATQLVRAGEAAATTRATGGPVTVKPQEDKTTAIDLGRQLFVDDYLVSQTTLRRAFHAARFADINPVLKPETPTELGDGKRPVATTFDDGVWCDPKDGLFKLWYMAGWMDGNAYATSKDGLHWERPKLDVVPGSNRVLPVRERNGSRLKRDAATIWLDHNAADASVRYKMAMYSRLEGKPEGDAIGELFTSPDGIHWKTLDVPLGWRKSGWYGGDNSSFYYDPFRALWVHSIRSRAPSRSDPTGKKTVRARYYFAHADFERGFAECTKEAVVPARDVPWLAVDDLDLPDAPGFEPELYDFTAVGYESLMLGAFAVLAEPPGNGKPKLLDLKLGFSRDGYHFERPDHHPFLACSRTPGSWNRGYFHPVSGVCLIVGDQLHFYFSAWSGVSQPSGSDLYAGGSVGLALLRRDGFASMDAGSEPGTLTTTPLSFKGKYPFVNVAATGGELRMEVVGADGKVVAPYSFENCVPVTADSTHQQVKWKGGEDLAALAGKPVQFRFQLTKGQLYSFWVSPDVSGASNGYVAAGGPGFTGATDTVGNRAPR